MVLSFWLSYNAVDCCFEVTSIRNILSTLVSRTGNGLNCTWILEGWQLTSLFTRQILAARVVTNRQQILLNVVRVSVHSVLFFCLFHQDSSVLSTELFLSFCVLIIFSKTPLCLSRWTSVKASSRVQQSCLFHWSFRLWLLREATQVRWSFSS